MNPLTNVKNIAKLNEIELSRGLTNKRSSWHDQYKDSAWIFVGGLAYGLTEGDVLAVFSQYGEIVNINMVRNKETGKIKGFCFICYANQKSTILAVDNFNGIKLCGRTIRVDHVSNYKMPKEHEDDDEITKNLHSEGCAPKADVRLEIEPEAKVEPEKKKKPKKKKKHKKKKSHKKGSSSDSSDESVKVAKVKQEETITVKVKQEKYDPGYDYSAARTSETASQQTSSQSDHSHKSAADYQPRNGENSHVKHSQLSSRQHKRHSSPSTESSDDKYRKSVKSHKKRREEYSADEYSAARKDANTDYEHKEQYHSKDHASKYAEEKHWSKHHKDKDFSDEPDSSASKKKSNSSAPKDVARKRTKYDSSESSTDDESHSKEKRKRSYHGKDERQSAKDSYTSRKKYEGSSDEDRDRHRARHKSHNKHSRSHHDRR